MEKRAAITKELIISKAIELADRGGITALSMRKLATELNIQAMSLYYHIKTKDDLIANMADRLVSDIDLGTKEETSDSDWRVIMLERARSAKALFQEQPRLPFVLDSQIQSGIKRLEYLNNYLGIMRKIGFPIDVALKLTSLIDSYVYGYCKQLTHTYDSDKSAAELAEDFASGFDASKYPYLHEAASLTMEKGYDADADFLYGINVILNGISLELESIVLTSKVTHQP